MDTALIYSKMAAIMKETRVIAKSRINQQQGFKFRGIDNVMNELHDIFANNEVFIIPKVEDFTIDEKTTKSGSILYYTRARIVFQYTTTDGSSISTINVGEAMDSGDKGMNKAMSIALKYSLLQMLLIPTEEIEDPDSTIPPETVNHSNAAKPVQNKPVAPKTQKKVLLKENFEAESLMAWIYKSEQESKKQGKSFSAFGLIDSFYSLSKDEINQILNNFNNYRVNNNL